MTAVVEELAQQKAQVQVWQVRVNLLEARIKSMTQSRAVRLFIRLSKSLRRLRPSTLVYSGHGLYPQQYLVCGTQANEWLSTGNDPQFVLSCDIPAGWLHLDVGLDTEVHSPMELYLDTGAGFNSAEVIHIGTSGLQSSSYWPVPKAIRTVRFDPLATAGIFRLSTFTLRSASRREVYGKAFNAQWQTSVRNGCLGASVMKGLKLLASGRFGTMRRKLLGRFGQGGVNVAAEYSAWVERHTLTEPLRQRIRAEIIGMPLPPKISVIMPIYNVPERFLRAAVESVRRQLYPHWELCIADDCSPSPHVRRVLEEYVAQDPRVRVVFHPQNGGISETTNSALSLAQGEFVAFLDHDDEYAEHALYRIAREIVRHPDVDMIYTDEDKIDAEGNRRNPFFKPDWSPEYFLSFMYTCHLSVYRTQLVRELGGLRSDYDGAQDYDLALRVVSRTKKIRHIPDVLYHWRMIAGSTSLGHEVKPQAVQAARRALESHLLDLGVEGRVEPAPTSGRHRVRFAILGTPLVSIVIPTASRQAKIDGRDVWLAHQCVQSIREKSTYRNIEIIIVDNNDMPAELADLLKPYNVVRVPFTKPFNLADKMNLGTEHSRGEFVVFLNDDIEIMTPDWIEGMLEYAQQEDIGAVGVKLRFPNGRLQHSGVLLLPYGPDHLHYNAAPDEQGYFSGNAVVRNVIAVTGACVMLKREDLRLIGGWSRLFPLNFNDVDLCLKCLERGRRIVYNPFVELRHYESVSKTTGERVLTNIARECSVLMDLWRDKFPRDPYYSINFAAASPFYQFDLSKSAEDLLMEI